MILVTGASGIVGHFVVKDLAAAIKFYSDVLGFSTDYISESPGTYAVVFRDDVYIHLSVKETKFPFLGPGRVFIVVNEIDDLWKQVTNSKAEIIEPISNKDYG